MTSVSALQARVQNLLHSRAELESTKALLASLVRREEDAASTTPSSGATSTTTVSSAVNASQSLAELRKSLRASLEEKQLALAESALEGVQQTLARVAEMKAQVDKLDAKCQSVQFFLETTKRETQQVQAEAAALSAKKKKVEQELAEIQAFLTKYQLRDDEVQRLYASAESDVEWTSFFAVMERVQQVKADCRDLVAAGDINCALELLDAVGKWQEAGFEHLYQWTLRKCSDVDGEPSTELNRAIAMLRDRPEFYNYCKETLTSSRRALLVRRFILALTQGGPNGIPRPIEMYAHDPIRYCGDMLAWVHQSIATESEFFRLVLDSDLDGTPLPDPSSSLPETDQPSSESNARVSVVGRAFEGVARPLQVRIEQTLASQHDLVVASKLVHLLAFYHHKFDALVPHSAVAQALAACRDAANRAFQQQLQVLIDHLADSAQDYAANLAATHMTMEVSHCLAAILDVFQSSLLSEDEKEADLAPIFEGILPALRDMCARSVTALDPIDALVFQINNLGCLRAPLSRFPDAKTYENRMDQEIDQHLRAMCELHARRLLDRYNISIVVAKIAAAKEKTQTQAEHNDPELDEASLVHLLEQYFTALAGFFCPQLDHLSQSDWRDRARRWIVTTLAEAYSTIYEFLLDPANGYAVSRTQHARSATGQQPLATTPDLPTPMQVRTLLEIE